MAYQQYQTGNQQSYNQRPSGNGGGYNQRPYNPPVKKEFCLDDDCEKYALVFLTLKEHLESNGIKLEDVKEYLGGWTTSLKLSLDKV